MDDQVLRGMAKWPNVPAVYGWLALDRRGNWLLQGEPIGNATVTAYISRNYEHDSEGRWFFQNGPQRVFVDLQYTPLVYRTVSGDGAVGIETHTGVRATAISGAWIDEGGGMLLETEHGVGLLHDHDLETVLPALVDANGNGLAEDTLDGLMAALQQGHEAAMWLKLGKSNVRVRPIKAADVPARFRFTPHPAEPTTQGTLAATR